MEPEAGEAACALSEEERRCSANHVVYRVVRAKVRFGFRPRARGSWENESHVLLDNMRVAKLNGL